MCSYVHWLIMPLSSLRRSKIHYDSWGIRMPSLMTRYNPLILTHSHLFIFSLCSVKKKYEYCTQNKKRNETMSNAKIMWTTASLWKLCIVHSNKTSQNVKGNFISINKCFHFLCLIYSLRECTQFNAWIQISLV